jgi:hypothetical protein
LRFQYRARSELPSSGYVLPEYGGDTEWHPRGY